MTSMPPGWYDDGRGALRWWDGSGWTEHVAVLDREESDSGDGGVDDLPEELRGADDDGPGTSGAFGAATESTKSRLWIVWASLGVVLLAIVVAIAVAVPLLFLAAQNAGEPRGEGVAPADDEQEAAVEVVEQYNDAWLEADCDEYVDTTTQGFRNAQSNVDCAAFQDAARFFAGSVEDYTVTVTAIESDGDTMLVSTVDDYRSRLDENGEITERTQPLTDRFTYVLVRVDGDWVIDGIQQ